MKQLYFEYDIQVNRPGLLGAVTTLLGMLNLNILQVTSIGQSRRGFLLECEHPEKMQALARCLNEVESIKVAFLRETTLLDKIALKHGVRLNVTGANPPVYSFVREELGLLINFLGDILKKGGNTIIGIRGMPRVGKSEASIAACVYANKRWTLISSTIIRQTMRTHLSDEESDTDKVLLIDAITSTLRGTPAHKELLSRILAGPGIKIIEHPDVLAQNENFSLANFDLIIELRHHPDEEIRLENPSFNAFDIS
ncbi:MAG TPA: DUF3388 domain-containing protein [Desulfobacteria bacterium]|nr:DUF3388 domain-containing protein [Desulfobacteria bacterium]